MLRAPRVVARCVVGRAVTVAGVLGTALSGVQFAASLSAAADTSDVMPSANPIDITPRILDHQARSIVQAGDRMVVGGSFTQIQNAGSSTVVDQPYVFAFDPLTGKTAPSTATIAVYSGVSAPPVVSFGSAAELTTVNAGVAAHTTPQIMVPADGQWLVSYWADRTASLTTAWTVPGAESLRADEYSSGSSSRVTSLLTDGGGPTLAGTRGGLTATANSASRKATMWSIVLRSQ